MIGDDMRRILDAERRREDAPARLLQQVVVLLTEIRDRLPAPGPAPDNQVRLFGWALGEPAVPNSADYRAAQWFIENPAHVVSAVSAPGDQVHDQAREIALSVMARYRGPV